jgi:hypothetical protein
MYLGKFVLKKTIKPSVAVHSCNLGNLTEARLRVGGQLGYLGRICQKREGGRGQEGKGEGDEGMRVCVCVCVCVYYYCNLNWFICSIFFLSTLTPFYCGFSRFKNSTFILV